mmetsp:Transcript_1471/g.1702  ORF Transcript_1471/g.1702 Transcript_1471/m.1702 type:complete len:127 (+) Transcript_1471:64-444(+)
MNSISCSQYERITIKFLRPSTTQCRMISEHINRPEHTSTDDSCFTRKLGLCPRQQSFSPRHHTICLHDGRNAFVDKPRSILLADIACRCINSSHRHCRNTRAVKQPKRRTVCTWIVVSDSLHTMIE